MQTPTLTFRADKQLQTYAKEKAKKMWIPLSLILQQALKSFINKKTITFTENWFTPEFENLIIEAEKTHSSKKFDNSQEAINYLSNLWK